MSRKLWVSHDMDMPMDSVVVLARIVGMTPLLPRGRSLVMLGTLPGSANVVTLRMRSGASIEDTGCSAPSRVPLAGTCDTPTRSPAKALSGQWRFPWHAQLHMPNHQLISSEDVEGTNVYGVGGNKIGDIDHLMIDKVSGRVTYAVISFGGGVRHQHL